MQEITVGVERAANFSYDDGLAERVNRSILEYQPENVVCVVNVKKKNLINRFAPFQAYAGSGETAPAGLAKGE